jgi:hypothetical protein
MVTIVFSTIETSASKPPIGNLLTLGKLKTNPGTSSGIKAAASSL